MAVLILDSEAMSALAHPRLDPVRHQIVRAAMRSAARRGHPVRVPSAVLVELYRGAATMSRSMVSSVVASPEW
jgi:hypothetical protein